MDETPTQSPPGTPDDHIFTPKGQPLGEPPKKRWWQRALLVVGIVLGLIVLFEGVIAARRHYAEHSNTATNAALTAHNNLPAPATPTATPASATDDGSLQQDLQGVNTSLGSSASSQNEVNGGLNDSGSKVDVPTN